MTRRRSRLNSHIRAARRAHALSIIARGRLTPRCAPRPRRGASIWFWLFAVAAAAPGALLVIH